MLSHLDSSLSTFLIFIFTASIVILPGDPNFETGPHGQENADEAHSLA